MHSEAFLQCLSLQYLLKKALSSVGLVCPPYIAAECAEDQRDFKATDFDCLT